MSVLTGDNQQRGSKLFKITIALSPTLAHHPWPGPDTHEPSQSSYSTVVSLERLLPEMTRIKRNGGRILEITEGEASQSRTNFPAIMEPPVVELYPRAGEADVQAVIATAYKQVFGNIHVMESERIVSAESLLRNRSISVREFVRLLAKSDLYKESFFHCTSNNRFIELNFKHLLGRAPYNHSEIIEHLDRYQSQGYDAEIDSYIDSDEYVKTFGENVVPYHRGFKSQVGQQSVAAFGRMIRLFGGDASSDTSLNRNGQKRLVDPKQLLRSGRGIV
ncbi:phycobilisome rod-core linker polypeptide [Gloeobacter morelensis]|nr:phycobilisome rod-core linker polypeptide [Gloeobacter morelensis]